MHRGLEPSISSPGQHIAFLFFHPQTETVATTNLPYTASVNLDTCTIIAFNQQYRHPILLSSNFSNHKLLELCSFSVSVVAFRMWRPYLNTCGVVHISNMLPPSLHSMQYPVESGCVAECQPAVKRKCGVHTSCIDGIKHRWGMKTTNKSCLSTYRLTHCNL